MRLTRGRGCSECYDSGFKGRTGIYELMQMTDHLRSIVLNNPTVDTIQESLNSNGHITMKDFGYEKVREGVTTLEEIQRVTTVEM